MIKFLYHYLLLTAICLSLPSIGNAKEILSSKQERNLVSNINYLQFSIAKIKASDSKAIAEEEFYSVINDIDLNSISNDKLISEYRLFLDACAELKLKQNEKEFIKQLNERAQKNAYLKAFSNMGSIFVPGQSPQQMVASLIYTSVSNAFAIANEKNQLKTQLEKDMFYLDQDIMRVIYASETTLFTTSASLLSGESSNKRINENSMTTFVKALKLENTSERLNALNESNLKNSLNFFPPLWYELGAAYQNLGDTESALSCYRHFVELKNGDALRKDKNYIKLLKNKIQIYLGCDKSEVMINAKKNKKQILDCIKLIKSNYQDSDAGEMNAYLAKIYYLVGEIELSLNCLEYLINSKTLHPEYIEEAISLRSLIRSASQNTRSDLYQASYNFGKVLFGNNSEDILKVIPSNAGVLDKVKKFFHSDTDFVDDEHICFEIPSGIVDTYNITVSINETLYNPEFVKSDDSSNGIYCFIDYEIDEIDDEKSLILHFDSKDGSHEYVVTYLITHFADKYYNSAEKAYQRIGSDIVAHNAQKVVEFGNTVYGYKYQVSDEKKEHEKIRKAKEKEGKKYNWTKAEIGSAITKEFFKKLTPDLNYLQDRYKAVESSYYKQNKGILHSSQLATFGEKRYLVGIISIFDCKSSSLVSFKSDGDIIIENISLENTAFMDQEFYTLASIGDITSMVRVAKSYLKGYGIEKNEPEAVRWLLKASSKSYRNEEDKMSLAEACELLGKCYWDGKGVKKNRSTATIWFMKAKEYGFEIDPSYLK